MTTDAERTILLAERDHSIAVPAIAGPTSHEPIDAPFHTLLANRFKWFAPRGTTPTSVVIHCTAATNPASSTANFFASSTPSGSTQAVADDDEGFTCVPDDAVCAGAPPLNQEGLHIEQPGLESWTRATWLSHDAQLHRVAFHVAGWCKKYSIPVVLLNAADLVRLGERARGITYHQAISDAFHQSTHQDPGPGFPWDVFMPLVKGFVNGTGGDDVSFTEGWEFRHDNPDKPLPTGKDRAFNDGWHANDRLMALEHAPAGGASRTHVHGEGVTGPPREPAP